MKEVLMQRVRIASSGCWEWMLSIDKRTGYGRFKRPPSKEQYAHRWSYITFTGPIPDGKEIDHLCFNRSCINPDHLEAVTRSENMKRRRTHPVNFDPGAAQRLKTNCPKGHPYAGENLYVDARGFRNCRACKKVWNKNYSDSRKKIP